MANTENNSFKIISETEKTQQSFFQLACYCCVDRFQVIVLVLPVLLVQLLDFMYIIWSNFMIFMYLGSLSSWLLDNFLFYLLHYFYRN
jgi:hypothetical protein